MNLLKSLVFIFLFSSLLFAGCTQKVEPSAPLIATSPIVIKTQALLSSTPFPSKIPTQTATPILATLEPTAAILATKQVIANKWNVHPELEVSLSPNGKWAIVYDTYVAEQDTAIRIVDVISGREWVYSCSQVYKVESCDTALYPTHWSDNGEYLYFAPFPDADGPYLTPRNGEALLRLNLSTGEFLQILPISDSYQYSYRFSNDEKYLVYFKPFYDPPFPIIVRDLQTGKEIEFKLPPPIY